MDGQKSKLAVSTSSINATTVTTTSSDVILPRQRMVQDFLLIWVNVSVDESKEDFQHTIAQLRNIVNDVHVFVEQDEAIDFLTEVDNMKVFLIVSDTIGRSIVPLIHDISQLDTICIFCQDQSISAQWATKWSKIKGVHKETTLICETIQLAITQSHQDMIALSFMTMSEESSNQNLNQLEPSFMYTQIFKEILLEMKYEDKSIQDLATYCRTFYNGNMKELAIIKEFENNYRTRSPIWWYTRECFTYQMLNRALRLLEGDTIINMGFFIRDLHQQIEQLYRKQVSSYGGKLFLVYRGQGVPTIDFEKLLKSKGGLMSFNNFLSTSQKQEVSLRFARGALKKTDMIGTLFKITTDPSVSSTPFASIRDFSYFQKEEEVLFSMHTVFRVGEITKLDTNSPLYQVDVQLTADNDEDLHTLTKRIRAEVAGETGSKRLGELLIKLRQFDKATELYNVLLEQTSNQSEKAHYYYQLGYIKDHAGHYDKAIAYYEKSLEIDQKTLPANHPDLAASYNNIGMVYDNMGEYSKAFSYFEKSLEIYQKTLLGNHPLLATSYNNIGLVYRNMGEYSKALSFYEISLEIYQKTFPVNHPDLATFYNNIGSVYDSMGEYSNALSFHEKSLEIQEKTLPANHLLLATSYNNIGRVYDNMGEYSKALSFYEKSFEIYQKTLPVNHPHLATSYGNIGSVYDNMGEYWKALSFHEKALEIREKTLPANHPDLATSYNNIGRVYDNVGEYLKALSFYEKSLETYQKTLPVNHPDFATFYNNIGSVYDNMGEYSKALSFYEKSLEIYRKILLANHPYLATSYNNIGTVCTNMREYSKALSFHEKALEIYQKTLSANHPLLANSYNNIGSVYDNMGEYSKALSFHEKSLEICQKTLPANHPLLTTSYNNIGIVYMNISKYPKALSFYQRALNIFQSCLPSNHPNIKLIEGNIEFLKKRM